ncbi:MAG: hypothetical protein ACKVRN_07125 [Pyrinomonadaceae bacterium]
MITVLSGSGCSYYNQIMARKHLVDGSKSYKDRKFPQAEQLFREAIARDPQGKSLEGQTAQLFLARTIHSKFIGDRQRTDWAQDAINEYQKALQQNPKDQSSYKAIASLYDNLQKPDDWLKLVTARSANTNIPPEQRSEAFTSLAAKKNTCANEITDTDKTKKTVTKDGKQTFQFVKPESPEAYETLKVCIDDGMKLIDQALALETPDVKNAASINVKNMSDQELVAKQDLLKVYESARSYKASLIFQAMRLAEMDGRTPDRDRYKTEGDAARRHFLDLSDVVKKIEGEVDERVAAKEAEATGGDKVNTNAAANKK